VRNSIPGFSAPSATFNRGWRLDDQSRRSCRYTSAAVLCRFSTLLKLQSEISHCRGRREESSIAQIQTRTRAPGPDIAKRPTPEYPSPNLIAAETYFALHYHYQSEFSSNEKPCMMHMNSNCTVMMIFIASLYLAISLLPYVFIGEYWAFRWYPLNLPLSWILKGPLWPIGREFYVVSVSVINSLLIYALGRIIQWAWRKPRK
jgi:hypothetical protein